MKVTICMGSACFIKGSKKIADAFISLVDEYGLKDKVDLCGAFCMGRWPAGGFHREGRVFLPPLFPILA